jgi:hypothetical protein
MEIALPLQSDVWIKIAAGPSSGGAYPTARLQKGWRLIHAGEELAEEAVGFGLPVLKRGLQTIFPGEVELASSNNGSTREVTATFRLNLVEKIGQPGTASVRSRGLYALKDFLAALIRRVKVLRAPLTAISSTIRRRLGWQTLFEASDFAAKVKITYWVDPQSGVIQILVDTENLSALGITEVVVMNEQGARSFDLYRDSAGTCLEGPAIGCWDEVTADQASFVSETHQLTFTLGQVAGAKLYRGRELMDGRLAWAGFGYSFPPRSEKFSYAIRVERFS